MISSSTRIKVPFHDVDSMEVVWHGYYPKYLEIARCDLLDTLEFNYTNMRDSGYAWPIVDMRIKYIRSLKFDQVMNITATIDEWENRLKILYVISDAETDTVLSKAHTTQMAIAIDTGETCFETPLSFRQKIEASL